jgi:hypothetical protein
MPRYYFDIRDGEDLAPDDEGLELSTIEAAWAEAAYSLADMLREAVRTVQGADRRMAIEVRDDNGLALAVRASFEADRYRLDS